MRDISTKVNSQMKNQVNYKLIQGKNHFCGSLHSRVPIHVLNRKANPRACQLQYRHPQHRDQPTTLPLR